MERGVVLDLERGVVLDLERGVVVLNSRLRLDMH
jgi:hypothetical protein